ncbi:type IV secretion system protein [Streptomyces sp. NPDC048606]|uniref:type IV secretion system protein n=1 Tax=Streptomyces sp. NPDC048606 TaxID=3154726 RepID=UPI0034360D83
MGVGDLLPSPNTSVPDGQGTLYETYSDPALWMLDADYGEFDVWDPPVQLVASILAGLVALLGTAVVVIVQWTFEVTSLPPLQSALAGMIGGAAKGLTTTLLPTALCVGGFVAFTKHKEGGGSGGLSQIAWVMISGVVSVSLLSSPQMWVDGVDSGRQIGASVALNAASGGIGAGEEQFPFRLGHTPTYTGNARDDLLRKSSDAVWRTYVAGPWCIAEFGSFEACAKYGKEVLDKGHPGEDSKRKKWLQDNLKSETVGRESELWWEGHQPVQRVVVMLLALVAILIFAVLVLTLAFASLASLLGALMLLVAGPVFACLWVIPGRTRQWGVRWFDQLVGFTLQSFVVTTVLGCVLVVQVACTKMFGVYGWGPSTGLSIAAAIVALRFRRVIESIVGVSGVSSPIGAVAGLLAARSASRLMNRGGGATSSGSRPGGRGQNGGSGGGPGLGGTRGGGGGGGGTSGGGPRRFRALTIVRTLRPPTPTPTTSLAGNGASAGTSPSQPPATPAAVPGGGGITPRTPPTPIPAPTPARTQATSSQRPPTTPTTGTPTAAATTAGTSVRTFTSITSSRTPTAPAPAPPPAVTYRQAPRPGTVGPRQIQSRIRAGSTGATLHPTTPAHRRPATQPPPPRAVPPAGRRTAPVPAQRPGKER